MILSKGFWSLWGLQVEWVNDETSEAAMSCFICSSSIGALIIIT